MTLLIKDRVQEITSSGGTGPILLGTSFIAGYVDIGTAIGNGNTTPYVITDTTNNVYEIGVGQYILANTSLLRLQVLASSNANALVNFVAGPKNVFVDVPAAYISLTVRGLNQFASTTSANLASIISDAVGTGPLVFANNAVFVGPTIGVATGTSLTLSTALPIASGGTNSTATPTAGGAGYGTGTAHAYTAAGTSGQVLTSAGAGVPTWTSTASININGTVGATTPAAVTGTIITAADQTAFKETTSVFPTIRPTLNLDFVNSKVLDPRITFVRATTATYYDSQTTAMAEQNLVGLSNNLGYFSTYQATVTQGITAPDSSTTAINLVESTANTNHAYSSNITTWAGATYTYSAYFKTNTAGRYGSLAVVLGGNGAVWTGVTVDPSLGTINLQTFGGSFTSTSATITPSANGFYRVTLTFTTPSAILIGYNVAISNVYPSTSTGNSGNQVYIGDGTSGIYIWGAQLEQRSSATAYTPTTTAAITNYIPVLMTAPAGVPRLDYNPTTGQALGLLIEEQRTNLLTSSIDFTTGWQSFSTVVMQPNATTAPDGTLTAYKFYGVPGAGFPSTYTAYAITIPVGADICFSIYVKAKEFTAASFNIENPINGARVTFNIDLVALTMSNGQPLIPVGNGWYRAYGTVNFGGSYTQVTVRLSFVTSSGNSYLSGDGYSGIYIWGAQLEAGSFPTSYIPTTSAALTRTADQASMTGTNFSSWYNQSQGTVYSEHELRSVTDNYAPWGFVNGVLNNFDLVTSNFRYGTTNINLVTPSSVGNNKFAGSYSLTVNNGTHYASVNGSNVVSVTNNSFTTIPTIMTIGQSFGAFYLNGHIRKLSYYPQALSSANLVALTS